MGHVYEVNAVRIALRPTKLVSMRYRFAEYTTHVKL